MKENKIFPWIVAISAASISFSAAFYSIFGIGMMFAGASTNVMVMAASLEFAKLVIASFLYRFWDDVNKGLRAYLAIACFILILITSGGIYGFLSSAYQETANKVENIDKITAVLGVQKEMVQKQLTQAEKQLESKSSRQNTLSDMRNRQQTNADSLISQNKSAASVRNQINSLGKESKDLDNDIKILQDTIFSKNQQISNIEMEILNTTTNNELAAEVGPLKYIAKLTGKSLDQIVNWFIIALMLVFDPLAVALVIAANFVFSHTSKTKVKDKGEPEHLYVEDPEIKNITSENTDISEDEFKDLQEPQIDEVKIETQPVLFKIGGTPIKEIEEILPEEDLVFSPELSDDEDQDFSLELLVDGNIEEITDVQISEEPGEKKEGEFGGYKLGNVYKGKGNIKDYKNAKDIPLDLLITKGDPTRL